MDICKKLIELESELKDDMTYISKDKSLIDDSYQDAYIKLQRYSDERKEFYGTEKSIKSLLKFVCKNILIDKLRKAQRDKVDYVDDINPYIDHQKDDDDINEVYQHINNPYVTKKLQNAFNNMSHEMYMTYKLRQKGLNFNSIAYLTDTTRNTALQRMRYARIKVEKEFKLT